MSEIDLERRVSRALHVTPRVRREARDAVMARIRASGAKPDSAMLSAGRVARHALAGLALAAGIGSVTTLASLSPTSPVAHDAVTTAVIGDSVVDRLRDTLRLVRLIFDDTTAHNVAVVGDFNHWGQNATRMQRDPGTRKWSVTLALHDGEHRYAILVDNVRWTKDMPHRSFMVSRVAN